MCMLIAKPHGIEMPGGETLGNCEWSNRDGIGVAWADPAAGVVRIKKDFATLFEFKDWLTANRTAADAMLIHFRLATHGGVSIGMRHPFPVTGDVEALRAGEITCPLAMAHNGVLYDIKELAGLSDTATFIKLILSDPAVVDNLRDNKAIHTLIAGMIGSYNKLAFLWPDGYVLTFGEFHKHQGALYSNEQFKRDFGWWNDKKSSKEYTRVVGGLAETRKLLEDTRRAKPNSKDYCSACYQEVKVKKMILIAGEDNEIVYLCKQCFNKRQRSNDAVSKVTMKCELCQEYLPQEELAQVDWSRGQAKPMLVCAPCETGMGYEGFC